MTPFRKKTSKCWFITVATRERTYVRLSSLVSIQFDGESAACIEVVDAAFKLAWDAALVGKAVDQTIRRKGVTARVKVDP